jgi:hypothetical protein
VYTLLLRGSLEKLRTHVKNIAFYGSLRFMFHDFLTIFVHRMDPSARTTQVLIRLNNEGLMGETLKKYMKDANGLQSPDARIAAIHDEDYESHWGSAEYDGKVVLDVGADIGSTADFFLRKGAMKVIAVEGSRVCFEKLKINADAVKAITPVSLFISRPDQIECLILNTVPDIVKMDIEGCEANLFRIDDEIFKRVPEYAVEVHSPDLLSMMLEKCVKNNYEVISIKTLDRRVNIVHVKRKDLGG